MFSAFWHARHSSVLELGAVHVTASGACRLRLRHVARLLGADSDAIGAPDARANASKFKVLSVVVPPNEMNQRSITDLQKGEAITESKGTGLDSESDAAQTRADSPRASLRR